MSATAIDLFAGLGGWSFGAEAAGLDVIWAANHWKTATEFYELNHGLKPVCQDLREANWSLVPGHDVLLASPCCQGHSRARGKENGNPEHDESRSTAWAVVDAAEFHKPKIAIIENVVDFMKWSLYPAWAHAMNILGYSLSPHVVDCASLEVPQNRERLFIVCTRSKNPIDIKLPEFAHSPASSFIDFESGNWSLLDKPGRAAATLSRAAAGRDAHGDRFLMPYYKSGSGLTGRSLSRPIGTITTRARWALVVGDRMRMLTVDETMQAMTFPKDTQRPKQNHVAIHLAGNAVPPKAAQHVIEAVLRAA